MSGHIKSPVLINAAEMARRAPFARPGETVLRELVTFDFAQVTLRAPGFLKDRNDVPIWVEIIESRYPLFVGRVGTAPGLQVDDLIHFHADNIFAVKDCSEVLEKFRGKHPPPNV